MRRGDKTPDQLDRPEGNDLETNYEKHDVGHAHLVRQLNALGYEVEEWGIDMRDDDGEGGIIYDDKMDFKVFRDGELVGLVDVKTKSRPRYMGRFNLRHYDEYHQHARTFDVPVFVVMCQVDRGSEEVHDQFVFEVRGDVEPRVRVETSDGPAVERFPDGNGAVLVPHDARQDIGHLSWRLGQETST